MKLNITFHPLLFQSSLSAGGVALMPFSFLHFDIPHGPGLLKYSDILWSDYSLLQSALYGGLIAIMLIFTAIHFVLTALLLKELFIWALIRKEHNELISDPFKNTGIFAPISSLAMSANVFWSPLGFFVPGISENLQRLMVPSFMVFIVLWIFLFVLEMKVIKIWLMHPLDMQKFNFTWLLDVFSFALVNLMGTGIAAMTTNYTIASIAAFMSMFSMSVGISLLVSKLVYLIYHQMKSDQLPDKAVIPAVFIVVPVLCLFGLSFYRILLYLQNQMGMEVEGIAFVVVNFSYVMTIAWAVFGLYVLNDYFKNDFKHISFSAPQWGLVCTLVGSQILGVYVRGLYFDNLIISAVNVLSILVAVIVYTLVALKFKKTHMIPFAKKTLIS